EREEALDGGGDSRFLVVRRDDDRDGQARGSRLRRSCAPPRKKGEREEIPAGRKERHSGEGEQDADHAASSGRRLGIGLARVRLRRAGQAPVTTASFPTETSAGTRTNTPAQALIPMSP